MRFRCMVFLLAALFALPAFAHGDKKHVVGTIEKLSPESVIVKTTDGKSVEVKLSASTVYVTSADKPAKFADLAVGQRVVIHADAKGADLVAATVKFAPEPGAGSASPKKAKAKAVRQRRLKGVLVVPSLAPPFVDRLFTTIC